MAVSCLFSLQRCSDYLIRWSSKQLATSIAEILFFALTKGIIYWKEGVVRKKREGWGGNAAVGRVCRFIPLKQFIPLIPVENAVMNKCTCGKQCFVYCMEKNMHEMTINLTTLIFEIFNKECNLQIKNRQHIKCEKLQRFIRELAVI